jgi:hypothetical protein
MFNWLLGKYIAYAVNDPKKYPKEPFMQSEGKSKELKPMTAQQMQEFAKNFSNKFNTK